VMVSADRQQPHPHRVPLPVSDKPLS
jgi:hypothetical protein